MITSADHDDDIDLDALIAGWDSEAQEAPSGQGPGLVGYRAAHARVAAARGAARALECTDCHGQAEQWSYLHDDADEVIADDRTHAGKAYSLNPAQYAPRCRACHVTFDKAQARRRRGESTPPAPGWEPRSWTPEAAWDIRRGVRAMLGLEDQPLDDVRELLGCFIAAQDDSDLDAVTLWIAATHLAAHGIGQAFPRLAVLAPSHGSGKSTLLELVERLSHQGERVDSTVTDALLPRILMGAGFSTLTIDEADKTLKPENSNTTAILNAGWKRGATARINMPSADKGWTPEKIDVFSPVAFAGNGVRLAPDTRDRTITVRLYQNQGMPELQWDEVGPVAGRLRERLAAWAEDRVSLASVKRPAMPEGVGGRDRERWQILTSAAEATQRADWRGVARLLCLDDHQAREADREANGPAPQVQLVLDLFDALPAAEAWPTQAMVGALIKHDPEAYGFKSGKELGDKSLSWRLDHFWGLKPARHYMPDGTRRRGYTRAQLVRVWGQAGVSLDGDEA